jgi:hypothetical protein
VISVIRSIRVISVIQPSALSAAGIEAPGYSR